MCLIKKISNTSKGDLRLRNKYRKSASYLGDLCYVREGRGRGRGGEEGKRKGKGMEGEGGRECEG